MNTAPKLHERLLKVAEGLKFNRETHVVWRDWLLKSPDNEKVNPHAGNAKFHDDTIREYDEHLATIDETLAALAPPSGEGVDSRLVPFEPPSEVIERICQVNAGNSIWPDDYDPRAQSIRRERAYATYAVVLATATTPQPAPGDGGDTRDYSHLYNVPLAKSIAGSLGQGFNPNVPNGESLHPASELDQLRQRLTEIEVECREAWKQAAYWRPRAEQAEAKLALAEQDARRWQWFRDHGYKLKAPMCYFDIGCQPDELDQAIDAAIASQGKK